MKSLFDSLRAVRRRKTTQQIRVGAVMRSGEWLALNEIQRLIVERFDKYDSEAAISARIRGFRKGGATVEARVRKPTRSLWEYRLVPNPTPAERKYVGQCSSCRKAMFDYDANQVSPGFSVCPQCFHDEEDSPYCLPD